MQVTKNESSETNKKGAELLNADDTKNKNMRTVHSDFSVSSNFSVKHFQFLFIQFCLFFFLFNFRLLLLLFVNFIDYI